MSELQPDTQPTDTEILDWMEYEGMESVVRLPTRGGVKWMSHWSPRPLMREHIFDTLREAAVYGMRLSSVYEMRLSKEQK